MRAFLFGLCLLFAAMLLWAGTPPPLQSKTTLIKGGLVVDGTGKPGRIADVRIEGDKILEVGRLNPRENEKWLDAKGLVVAPGFIDAHSHTDRAAEKEPLLESQVRQGITTAVVGQDGGSEIPITKFFDNIRNWKPAINFATFAGHGSLRSEVMGEDYRRGSKDAELAKMKSLLEQAMKDGALGLSSGLEYDPGYYSNSVEVIDLAKIAAKYGGMYISHIREDGTHGMMQALEELRLVAKEAKLPAQISHIKLGVAAKWGAAPAVVKWIADARKAGLDITADVYPWLYWQSTIVVLTSDRNWDNPEIWVKALADVGGPQNVLLTRYSPDPSWEGKNLEEIAKLTGKGTVAIIQEIIKKTRGPGANGSESIVCKAMTEPDLEAFLRDPNVMFCTDGSHGGSHPRGAGSFPRIFGKYVRDLKVLSLEQAVHKASAMPAKRFGFKDRGEIRTGMKADLVVFDPKTIQDKATPQDPRALSEGMIHVFVNGIPVLEQGKLTGARPGLALRRSR